MGRINCRNEHRQRHSTLLVAVRIPRLKIVDLSRKIGSHISSDSVRHICVNVVSVVSVINFQASPTSVVTVDCINILILILLLGTCLVMGDAIIWGARIDMQPRSSVVSSVATILPRSLPVGASTSSSVENNNLLNFVNRAVRLVLPSVLGPVSTSVDNRTFGSLSSVNANPSSPRYTSITSRLGIAKINPSYLRPHL